MKRSLVFSGITLVAVGAILLVMFLTQATAPVAPAAAPLSDPAATLDPPSRVWPIFIGLLLAAGAALIGIGMNRWKRAA